MDVSKMFKLPQLPAGKNKRRLDAGPTADQLEQMKRARTEQEDDERQRAAVAQDKGKGKARAVTVADEEEEGRYEPPGVPDDFFGGDEDEDGRFFGGGLTSKQKDILDIFDKAGEGNEGPGALTLPAVRKQLKEFDRTVQKNQELRVKYPDNPSKFIDSEADLDAALNDLKNLTQDPNTFYPELVKSGMAVQLVGLLSHENTDIAIDVVEVLEELTDEDVVDSEAEGEEGEDEDPARGLNRLVDTLLENAVLDLLVANLSRLDEEQETDRQGIFHTLGVFENLLSLRPQLGETLVCSTTILSYLLERIKPKTYDSNKQYASEILAILLQNSRANRLAVGEKEGVDTFLRVLSQFRRRDPADVDELEFLENVFNALCSALAEPEIKKLFLEAEGVELMNLVIREKLVARTRAIKVLDHALSGPAGSANSERFVEAQGLKLLFSAFMHRAPAKKSGLGATSTSSEDEEHLLGIFVSLFSNLGSDTPERLRLLTKFVEREYEKVDRLLEVRENAEGRVQALERSLDEDEDEDEAYLRRLEAGLFTLQMADYVIAWLAMEDDGIRDHIELLLKRKGKSFADVVKVLEEYADNMGEVQPTGRDEAPSQKEIIGHLIEYLQPPPANGDDAQSEAQP